MPIPCFPRDLNMLLGTMNFLATFFELQNIVKCLDESEAAYPLVEVHEGIFRQHLGGRALAKKVLRKGYYWPTMTHNAMEFVKKCEQYQRHGDVYVAPWTHHIDITMALLKIGHGRFRALPHALSQLKFLIVGFGYCTKWIEIEPLVRITPANFIRFFKKTILARYKIPQIVLMDNGPNL